MSHSIPCIGYVFIEKDRRRVNMAYLKKLNISDGPHLQKLVDGKSITHNGTKVDVDKATRVVTGRRFAIIPDTSVTPMAAELARDADVMIIESTYCTEHEDRAEKHKHLTAQQAALLAQEAGAKKLILTHFSQRYENTAHIEEEARTYFPDAQCAHDFMKIKF
ncbi:MAG: MBL fold metallo-hydrolase [Patescibacteria group bacterium]